jgi:hypothetical protein
MNFRYYRSSSLEGLKKTTKNSSQRSQFTFGIDGKGLHPEGCSSGSAVDLYSEGTWLEPQPGILIESFFP